MGKSVLTKWVIMYVCEMRSFFFFCSDGVARIFSRYKSMVASRKEQEVSMDLILLCT